MAFSCFHTLEVVLVLLSEFAADLLCWFGDSNFHVQTQFGMFHLPLKGKKCCTGIITNKPYSKVGVLHLIHLWFSFSYMLKKSDAFPCIVVKNPSFTVLNICEEMMSVCFITDSGVATPSGFRVLSYQCEVEGVC